MSMLILGLLIFLGAHATSIVAPAWRDAQVAAAVLREITARLDFLLHVGLSYLTMSRAAGTLSGGEAQRIRLASQLGSGLVGALSIEAAAKHLNSRDIDGMVLGEGAAMLVIEPWDRAVARGALVAASPSALPRLTTTTWLDPALIAALPYTEMICATVPAAAGCGTSGSMRAGARTSRRSPARISSLALVIKMAAGTTRCTSLPCSCTVSLPSLPKSTALPMNCAS